MDNNCAAAWTDRTARLVGAGGVAQLAAARVAIFGLGGVGSYAVEGLARAGVGAFFLVDGDEIDLTNINRQLPATRQTVGRAKTEVVREHILAINPAAAVEARREFVRPDNGAVLFAEIEEWRADYIVDAVDDVAAKIALAAFADAAKIPLISAMGAGNRLDPTRFKVADIYSTSGCPLAKIMRRELKKRGIAALKAVYSDEPPRRVPPDAPANKSAAGAIGSISFVPSVMGLVMAGEVVKDLLAAGLPR